jgi:hypothetical protein
MFEECAVTKTSATERFATRGNRGQPSSITTFLSHLLTTTELPVLHAIPQHDPHPKLFAKHHSQEAE